MESKIQENGDLHQNFIYNSLSYDGYERFHDEVMENVSVSIQCSEYQEIGTSTLNLNSHKEKMKISLSQEQLQLNNDGRSCLTVPSSASRKIRSTESLGNSRSESTKLVKLEFQQPIVTKETSKLIAEDNFITVTPPQDSANDNEVIYAIPTKGIHDLSKETPYNLINEKNEIKTSSASLTPLKSSKIAPTSIASTTEFNQDVKYSFSFYCSLCNNIFNDPRTLDCLHSFCVECLARLDASNDLENNQFWRKISDHSDLSFQEPSLLSSMESDTVKKSGKLSLPGNVKNRKFFSKDKASFLFLYSRSPTRCIKGRHSSIISFSEKPKSIICPTCGLATEMTIHGVYRLPQNILIARKIREATGNSFDRLSNSCQLCPFSVDSTTSCTTCALNLCNNCKAVHKRHTSNHEFKSLEKKSKKFFEKSSPKCSSSSSIKCLIHSNNVLKLFCTTCCALICSECTILIHRGHKMTSVSKAAKIYIETLKEAKDNTKPLSIYAIHSISKLNEISKKINLKCDVVEDEVMMFISEYFEALEVHKQTLLHQIARCRETKMDIIKCQQIDLERRSNEAKTAIDFTETLLNEGTDEENLMFLNLLLRKFDSCRSSDKTLDIKITDSLQFLPEVKAPSNQAQKNIPLYGIITTQVAVARNCTLDVISGLMNLRVHKKAELILLTRDVEERAMCHGSANVEVKATYRDIPSKDVPVQVTDKRDGTYTICFIPDIPGFIKISIMVNGKSILDSPFTVRARNLRPHIGIFHCCSFCSSNGKKICACGAEMEIEGYKGCGHGHHGWPGRRHWSCCGSLLENSECSVANAISKENLAE